MKSTRSEEDFPLNSESDVSGASFSDDDGISEASEDHMSTISIDNSAGHKTDGDDDQVIEIRLFICHLTSKLLARQLGSFKYLQRFSGSGLLRGGG
jgi:hypothetical protein